ncbi:hypothetical protein WICPIJ_003097 [Wickerhamomyces pijperi]|uniref:Uncharacterized protein n=1 Tax=Wickerhamomyces pijperi TaxID=599730 RepID=A0A9P8TNA7_WICPI|nr:hypothetical protein WICPIJ_003097 [Wickerhamomyces pijperi]
MTQSHQTSTTSKQVKKNSRLAWVKRFVYSGTHKAFGSSKSKQVTTKAPQVQRNRSHEEGHTSDVASSSLSSNTGSSGHFDFHNIILLSDDEDEDGNNEQQDTFNDGFHKDESSINAIMATNSRPKSLSFKSSNSNKDNASTIPVISLSTASIRSSTFSESSQPSTSGTIFSDNQTIYTNSSTMGIAPASIMDRNRQQGGTQRFYFGNNLSNNTFLTFHSAARSIHTTNANDSLYDNHST